MASPGVWETEDETDLPVSPAATALPTPADTPYRTPSRNSRKARRSVTPPPLPGTDKTDKSSKRSSRDLATDDSISILDPRRFTPTLHANLVSEILNLRRDQEEKLKIIESLETALHATRQEQESLQENATTVGKENRSLKRQLALLEGGTSSALGELARERDEAAETSTETRKRLETLQKRLRHAEEDLERSHKQWEEEKEVWADDKRKLERKVHVADSRLKSVLEEVAAFHAETQGANGLDSTAVESETEEGPAGKDGKDGDAASVRTMSMTNSIRFSVISAKANGHSLADELNFDGDDDYETDNGRESVLSNYFHGRNHSRNQSRDSLSRSHNRNQSNESLRRNGSIVRGRFMNQTVLERLEGGAIPEDEEDQQTLAASVVTSAPPKVDYADAAVQYSPPPSPKFRPESVMTDVTSFSDLSRSQSPLFQRLHQHQQQQPQQPQTATLHRGDRSSMQEGQIDSAHRSELGEIEANQRRKRVHIARPLTIEPVIMSPSLMVSVGSQTMAEEPLSPPKTPKSPFENEQQQQQHIKRDSVVSLAEETKPVPAVMVCSSTQTDPPAPPSPVLPPLSQMSIPYISIIPPTSRPTTPREPRLPPLFKDFGCQVEISLPMPCKSVSVQTDEIRVDKRLDRLPPHLHPSAITSRPSSPGAIIVDPTAAAVDDLSRPVPTYVPPRNPRRLAGNLRSSLNSEPPSSPPPVTVHSPTALYEDTHDAYPGNNDDGPLSSQKAPMRRPHRISSLFAGFDAASSDEADEFMDGELSDSEFRTALSAPKPKGGSSRVGNKRASGIFSEINEIDEAPSPDQVPALPRRSSTRNTRRSGFSTGTAASTETYSKFPLPDSGSNRDSRDYSTGRRMSTKGSRLSYEKGSSVIGTSGNKSSVMRKAAMIQSGIASHQGWSGGPSTSEVRDPPFPIPTRASSRKPPTSASAPSDGQRSPTRRGSSRGHYRVSSIRKVRSAAAIPVKPRPSRRSSRSPPRNIPFSEDGEPESPGMPPLPSNDITTSRMPTATSSQYKPRHRHQMSTTTANTAVTDQTANSSNQATGVVDAIAQTMVGEWMFKYVRRRKSFGGADVGKGDDSSNDRHRRWVWLAPYERAILWSSKQPSNNSTLMGKSGRKLTIQSVLDVKDDNPPPKGCPQLFNRSILILTPQRALKFTATTAERHYLWLTSLSFLAHSQQAVPENIAVPVPKAAPDFELPQPKRRNGIRDSIRLTKSKGAMVHSAHSGASVVVPPVPEVAIPPPMSVSSEQTDSLPPSIPSYRPAESVAMSAMSAPSVTGTVSTHQRDTSRDTAEPPVIARYYDRGVGPAVHGRKRSNTGGHVPPPLSFRGFSGPASNSSSYHHASTNSTAGQSDISQSQASTNVTWGMVNNMLYNNGVGGSSGPLSSQRTSEASSRPSGVVMNNFFDAIGTVRMEAFISPLTLSQFDEFPDEQEEMRYRARRRSKEARRRASRSRHRDSYHSRGTRNTGGTDDYYSGSRTGGEEDYFRDDPFKGF